MVATRVDKHASPNKSFQNPKAQRAHPTEGGSWGVFDVASGNKSLGNHRRALQVKNGDLEIQGGIYDLGTGRVQLLGPIFVCAASALQWQFDLTEVPRPEPCAGQTAEVAGRQGAHSHGETPWRISLKGERVVIVRASTCGAFFSPTACFIPELAPKLFLQLLNNVGPAERLGPQRAARCPKL